MPVVLGLGVGGLMVAFGWLPEDARLCTAFEHYGFAPDPACFTPMATRLLQLLEAFGLWTVFGLTLFASFRWRQHKACKTAQA